MRFTMPIFMAMAANHAICDNRKKAHSLKPCRPLRSMIVKHARARNSLELSYDKEQFCDILRKWIAATN